MFSGGAGVCAGQAWVLEIWEKVQANFLTIHTQDVRQGRLSNDMRQSDSRINTTILILAYQLSLSDVCLQAPSGQEITAS